MGKDVCQEKALKRRFFVLLMKINMLFVLFLNFMDQGSLPHFVTMTNFWIITSVSNPPVVFIQSTDHIWLQRIHLCCTLTLSSFPKRKTNDIPTL